MLCNHNPDHYKCWGQQSGRDQRTVEICQKKRSNEYKVKGEGTDCMHLYINITFFAQLVYKFILLIFMMMQSSFKRPGNQPQTILKNSIMHIS